MRCIIFIVFAFSLIMTGCSSDGDTPTKPTLPVPSGLQVSAVTPESVTLAWRDSLDFESGWRVERSPIAQSEWRTVADLRANTTTYLDSDVQEADGLQYRIRVLDGDRVSSPSNLVRVIVPLKAPTGLFAMTPAEIRVDLSWYDSSEANWGYEVYRHDENNDWTQIGWSGGDTYSDTTILFAAHFTYRVRAARDSVFSGYSNEIQAISPFFPPGSLIGTRLSSTAIGLTWRDSSRYEQGYDLERKIGVEAFSRLVSLPPNSIAYRDTGLTPNTTYAYRIRATHERQLSSYSNESRVVTAVLTPLPPTALTANSSESSPGEAGLHWIDNANNEDGYVVELSTRPEEGWREIARLGENVKNHQVPNLQVESTYYFRVYAFNNEGVSDYSNVAPVTIAGIPPAPGNLAAQIHDWQTVDLSWLDNSLSETGFRMERLILPDGEWQSIGEVLANTVEYADSTILQSTSYRYRVASFNGAGQSGFSDSVTIDIPDFSPAPPSEMNAEAPDWRAAILSWRDNSDDEIGFRLERRLGREQEWSELATLSADQISLIDSAIQAGENYLYRIRAFNEAGNSDFSQEAAVQIPDARVPLPPTVLTVQDLARQHVLLHWEHSDDYETGFCAQRKIAGEESWPADSTILPENASTYMDTVVISGQHYSYRVWAFNEIGNSEYSNEVSVEIPSIPTSPSNLTARGIDIDKVFLHWDDTVEGEETYFVERSEGDMWNFEIVAVLEANSISFIDSMLAPETEYFYRLYCTNEVGRSEYSNIASATTFSLVVIFEDFDEYEVDQPPPAPWSIEVQGSSWALITDEIGVNASQSLQFHDPERGENSVVAELETNSTRKASVTAQLYLSRDGYFGIFGTDARDARNITWQIQFESNGNFWIRDGLDFVEGIDAYPHEQWFELEIRFDADSSEYQVFIDGQPMTHVVHFRLNDHEPNASINFITYFNQPMPDAFVDNVTLIRPDPREDVRWENPPVHRVLRRQNSAGNLRIEDVLRAVEIVR